MMNSALNPASPPAWDTASPLSRFSQVDIDRIAADLEAECGGTLHFAVADLQTGQSVRYNADTRCKTASVIKLPILVHVALCVHEGSLTWDEKLTLTDGEKVDGSGVLTQLSAGLEMSLRDICTLMTIVSDNTATNMVIARIGVDAINRRMRDLGLTVTTCFRKAYSPDTDASRAYGLGVTTPDEMLNLITRLAKNEISSAAFSNTAADNAAIGSAGLEQQALCADLRRILAAQYYRDGIPRLLPEEWKYEGKTGAVDPVRNDVGLVTTPDGRTYALALFCQNIPVVQWTADNPGLLALARLANRLLMD